MDREQLAKDQDRCWEAIEFTSNVKQHYMYYERKLKRLLQRRIEELDTRLDELNEPCPDREYMRADSHALMRLMNECSKIMDELAFPYDE